MVVVVLLSTVGAAAAQTDDGYIHTFQTVNKQKRYTIMRLHEFYVQGYLLEAGVAHYRMTGGKNRRLYDAALKCADKPLTGRDSDARSRRIKFPISEMFAEQLGIEICRN